MKALILAGGRGTRIKEIFPDRPKPLLEIMGKPILELILLQLSNHEIYINANKDIEKLLRIYNVNLELEEKRQGNATPIRNFIEKHDIKDDFIVIYCDSWNNIDYKKLIEHHNDNKKIMTMSVKDISKTKSFGIVTMDNKNIATGFTRKRLVNMGVFICNPLIKNFILKNTFQDLDRDIFPRLVSKKQLSIYIHKNLWYDVGTKQYWNRRKKNDKLHK